MDYNFTANMEKDLDLIAEGKKSKYTILNDFYTYLQKSICIKTDLLTVNNQEKATGTNGTNGTIIGAYKKKDIILNSGKYGHYITYGKNNYSLKDVSDVSNKEEILKIALNIIREKKIWKIDKKTYTLKKGKFGYYLEEGKNNKISITKLINIIKKKYNDKTDTNEFDIIEKITKDDISNFINTLNL
jgi:topoisomerase IA-like protein